jgi:hypothetical protein
MLFPQGGKIMLAGVCYWCHDTILAGIQALPSGAQSAPVERQGKTRGAPLYAPFIVAVTFEMIELNPRSKPWYAMIPATAIAAIMSAYSGSSCD